MWVQTRDRRDAPAPLSCDCPLRRVASAFQALPIQGLPVPLQVDAHAAHNWDEAH